jgi:hypothetical protein
MKLLANIPNITDLVSAIGTQVDKLFTSDAERGEIQLA